MQPMTLVLPIQNEHALLGTKMLKVGAGLLNFPGGKIDDSDTSPEAAALRETCEESNLIGQIEDLEKVAVNYFYFAGELRYVCHVYILRKWEGVPTDTKEMTGFEWHKCKALPFHRMWVGDKYWLPLILAGKKIEAHVYFNQDASQVEDFNYKEISFI